MFDYIVQRGRLSEGEASSLIRQVKTSMMVKTESLKGLIMTNMYYYILFVSGGVRFDVHACYGGCAPGSQA